MTGIGGEYERGLTLASDHDRDVVSEALGTAFSQGRLTQPEFEERMAGALAARTHGELDVVLAGLGGYGFARPVSATSGEITVRRIVFFVAAFFASPFIFIGALSLFAGDDMGTRTFGLVFLGLALPGPIALYRWAHPRS